MRESYTKKKAPAFGRNEWLPILICKVSVQSVGGGTCEETWGRHGWDSPEQFSSIMNMHVGQVKGMCSMGMCSYGWLCYYRGSANDDGKDDGGDAKDDVTEDNKDGTDDAKDGTDDATDGVVEDDNDCTDDVKDDGTDDAKEDGTDDANDDEENRDGTDDAKEKDEQHETVDKKDKKANWWKSSSLAFDVFKKSKKLAVTDKKLTDDANLTSTKKRGRSPGIICDFGDFGDALPLTGVPWAHLPIWKKP